jgi:hypothetical protein
MHLPFTLAHPFRNQVTTADTEECAVCFRCHGFGKIRLSCTGGTVKQDTLPGLALASEQVRELDGKNDCLFQSFFCLFQASNILPFYVRLVRQNSTLKCRSKLLRIRIFAVIVIVLSIRSSVVSADKRRNIGYLASSSIPKARQVERPPPSKTQHLPSLPTALRHLSICANRARFLPILS